VRDRGASAMARPVATDRGVRMTRMLGERPNRFDDFDAERDRLLDGPPARRARLDPLALLLRASGYNAHHRFDERREFGVAPVLIVLDGRPQTVCVSRLYWSTGVGPVAVDLAHEVPMEDVRAAKRRALEAVGVLYAAVVDEFDTARLRAAVERFRGGATGGGS
jgi:hypothetical protein